MRYVLGAGAHGRIVADILRSQGLPMDGFLDDDKSLHGTFVAGYPVVGGVELLMDLIKHEVIVALGKAPLRLKLTKRFRNQGHKLLNAIHASAVIASSVVVGSGICVCAAAVINPDAVIGDAVIINTGATVDHDCEVGDGAHLSPGGNLAGRVKVGSLSFLGTGVSVSPRVQIGSNVIIGAGAVVISDIPDGVLAYGVPARVIRDLSLEPIDWIRLL
ncbi:MAG: acetyltransferase [Anaerolineales bacterium]|nr:acetyltransferase [Anaerolineales bacterium]